MRGEGGRGAGLTEGVKLLRLRATLHAIKLSHQNSFDELHS